MANVTKVTEIKKSEFLEALSVTANASKAAAVSGISRMEWYRTRAEDAEFAKQWQEAVEKGTDALEDEAIRRAHEGTDKPVYQGGKLVGYVKEYSDTLLIFMLKARRPAKFRELPEGYTTTPPASITNIMNVLQVVTTPEEAAKAYQRVLNGDG
jgi:hypothetical protein